MQREFAVARPLHRQRHQCPQDERVKHQCQRDGWDVSLGQQQVGNGDAEQHIVGEHATQREHRLLRPIVVEQPPAQQSADHEHHQTATKKRDQQPRIDARDAAEAGHLAKQQCRHGDAEDKRRQGLAGVLAPTAPLAQRVAEKHQHKQR